MDDSAIAVFTGKPAQSIIRAGGSGAWLLNPRNARRRRYLVCVRNGSKASPDAAEAHGSVFLVGEISDLIQLPDRDGVARWHIAIGTYALPGTGMDVWQHRRNPVWYTTLETLGIDPRTLTFTAVPEPQVTPEEAEAVPFRTPRKLTIAEAKAGLAATFGVPPGAIEIVIRA